MAVVDLLAVLPFYLPGELDLRFLRVLRVFRILRIAKLARYSVAMDVLATVVKEKRGELAVLLGLLIVVVLCSSTLMYFVEGRAQPDVFSSIPAAALVERRHTLLLSAASACVNAAPSAVPPVRTCTVVHWRSVQKSTRLSAMYGTATTPAAGS